jgi:hypothetical protein
MAGNLIINLGDLPKTVAVLIEKIAGAAGVVYEPHQIVRAAKAEKEAERLRTESQIETSDLRRRAFYRIREEEAKRQRNIEEITRQALPQVSENARPEDVEDDWIINFFDKCRLISDSEMQGLWSRILAGEANSPGSYSKRTVNFLSSLGKDEAHLFTKLCIFGCVVQEVKDFTPLIYETEATIYRKHGIHYSSLSHLESIGLITFGAMYGYSRLHLPKKIPVHYYGELTMLEFPKASGNTMNIGYLELTRIGRELAGICGSSPDPAFRDYLHKKWVELGYITKEKTEQDEGPPKDPPKPP